MKPQNFEKALTVIGQSNASGRSSFVQRSTFLELPLLHIHCSLKDVLSTFGEFRIRRVFVGNDMIRLEVENTLVEVTCGTGKVIEEEAVETEANIISSLFKVKKFFLFEE